jgi:hypothetical protein
MLTREIPLAFDIAEKTVFSENKRSLVRQKLYGPVYILQIGHLLDLKVLPSTRYCAVYLHHMKTVLFNNKTKDYHLQ